MDFVASIEGLVGAKSLNMYIKELFSKVDSANTLRMNISTIKLFFKHLVTSMVIPNETLPDTPKGVEPTTKKSFFEIASSDLDGLSASLKGYENDILEYASQFKLDTTGAGACFFSNEAIRLLHKHSLVDLRESLKDIDFCDSVVNSITDGDLQEYSGLECFSNTFKDTRTVEEAFAILYSLYNEQGKVPSPDYWPKGVYNFINTRGYKVEDVRHEFSLLESSPSQMMKNAIFDLNDEDIERYSKIEDWSAKHLNKKSIEVCFKILFIKFGRMLPVSADWPKGIADYCKGKGWDIKRVHSAFFPDRQVHQPLLIAFLSHRELVPNVDTVFFYTYLDAITPAFEPSKVRVFMGKHRGASVDKDISKNDPLVVLVKEYIEKYKRLLFDSELGRIYLRQENASIFGHLNRNRGAFELKSYDASNTSDYVHHGINKYAKEHSILKPLALHRTTGESFRPTHAVIDKLMGVPQGVIKTKLGHSDSSTTDGYTRSTETNALIQTKQRDFQSFMVEQARVSPNELEESSLNLKKLEHSKRVIFSNVNEIALWIAYRAKIYREKDRLILSNPTRWVKHWQHKLAEYEAIIPMVSSKDFYAATKIADKLQLPHLD